MVDRDIPFVDLEAGIMSGRDADGSTDLIPKLKPKHHVIEMHDKYTMHHIVCPLCGHKNYIWGKPYHIFECRYCECWIDMVDQSYYLPKERPSTCVVL